MLLSAFAITLAFSTFGQTKVYVANQLTNDITIIDADNNTVVGTLAPFNMPSNLAFTPDGAKGVITFAGSGSASIIDPTDPFNFTNLTCGAGASDVVISPDGQKAYIGNASAGTISVLDLTNNAVLSTWMGGGNGVALSPDGSTLYSTNKITGTVTSFNTATGTSSSFATGITNAERLAVSHDGKLICIVQNLSTQVSLLNTSDGSIEAIIPVGVFPTSVSFTADSKRALVTNTAGNSVSVIDIENTVVETSIPVTGSPIDIAVVPSANKAFTANNGAGTSTAIDLGTMAVQQNITCGTFPIAVSFAGEGFTGVKNQLITSKWNITRPSPNPVSTHTSFNATLEESMDLQIRIYNNSGRLIEELFSGRVSAGTHQFDWNPTADLTPGFYNILLKSTDQFAVLQVLKQ
ncbi:MAG: hypothetical protein CMN32_17190 [Saprospirales bacterium]|nr:hypothetical protein [Saprospirales bacterium]